MNGGQTLANMDVRANYASPSICQKLHDIGLTNQVSAIWKVYEKETVLVGYQFDTDDYYKQADANYDVIVPPIVNVPAYSIAELEILLPDYRMSMIQGEYQIHYDRYRTTKNTVRSNRLADAFAEAVLDLIQNNIINIEKANLAICQTN